MEKKTQVSHCFVLRSLLTEIQLILLAKINALKSSQFPHQPWLDFISHDYDEMRNNKVLINNVTDVTLDLLKSSDLSSAVNSRLQFYIRFMNLASLVSHNFN